ncbi:MAG: UbiA family prenyltransferase [Candidatus Nezhaarchaeales archaeon]
MSGRLIEWLRIGRIHTAPASIILLVSSFTIGGGSFFSLMGVILLLYGVLLHWSTFGHNVVMDYYWDLDDPGKKHHPLVSGRLKLNESVNTVLPILGITLLLGLSFAFGNNVALFWFALYMVGGFLYNNWLSKTTVFGFIPITLCFTSLSLYAMSLAGGVNVLYALYIMFTIWYQIGWSGYLKEIEVEYQANMLRRLGVRVVDSVLKIPTKAKIYGLTLKLGNLVTAYFLLIDIAKFENITTIIVSSVLVGLIVSNLLKTLKTRGWNRDYELKNMSLMEIYTIYLGMFLAMPLLEALTLAVFGVAWFSIMNRLLWGTRLTPKV